MIRARACKSSFSPQSINQSTTLAKDLKHFAASSQKVDRSGKTTFVGAFHVSPPSFLCRMQIPSGSNVEVVDGVFQITEEGAAMSYALPRCKANVTHPIMARALPPDYDGWLAYVGASNQRLHGSFISLPHVPT